MPGDINGFDPFPGDTRFPGDFFPGLAQDYKAHPDYEDSEGGSVVIPIYTGNGNLA